MIVTNVPHGRYTLRTFRCCGNLWELLYNDSPRWHWRRRWRPVCDTCGWKNPAPASDYEAKPRGHLHRAPSFFE